MEGDMVARRKQLGRFLALARANSQKKPTLEETAMFMGVSRNTIANWETGNSVPNLLQIEDLERFYGYNPAARLCRLQNPELYEGLEENPDSNQARAALVDYISNVLPDLLVSQLSFLFFGDHGSDPFAVLQEMTATLQSLLSFRYVTVMNVITGYEMTMGMGKINCPNEVQPNMKILLDAAEAGQAAAIKGLQSYVTGNK